MNIREARIGDEPELAALTTELGYPSTADDIARRLPLLLGRNDQRIFVAVDDDDRAVGWIHMAVESMLVHDRFTQILGLVVTEGARSGGIGAQLIAEGERWARERGASSVRVRSNVKRERAHRFYLRAGYAIEKTSYLFVKGL